MFLKQVFIWVLGLFLGASQLAQANDSCRQVTTVLSGANLSGRRFSAQDDVTIALKTLATGNDLNARTLHATLNLVIFEIGRDRSRLPLISAFILAASRSPSRHLVVEDPNFHLTLGRLLRLQADLAPSQRADEAVEILLKASIVFFEKQGHGEVSRQFQLVQREYKERIKSREARMQAGPLFQDFGDLFPH